MNRLTIHDIKSLTSVTSPYFFSRDTLKFFGQTMRSFSVKQIGTRYVRISAPMRDYRGKYMGDTVRYFDRETCELLSESRFNEVTQ